MDGSYIRTEEHKERMRNIFKDRIVTWGEKISEAKKGKTPSCVYTRRSYLGKNNPFYGKHHSMESRKKNSDSHIGIELYDRRGENNHNWKGGISRWQNKIRNTLEFKRWRTEIFKRDNWTCKDCGIRGEKGVGRRVVLNAHHIKSMAKYPEKIFDENNGITLCKDCHINRHKIEHKKTYRQIPETK